jgi:hypothetical protein
MQPQGCDSLGSRISLQAPTVGDASALDVDERLPALRRHDATVPSPMVNLPMSLNQFIATGSADKGGVMETAGEQLERIRTRRFLAPKRALYEAQLRPVLRRTGFGYPKDVSSLCRWRQSSFRV